MFDYKRYKAWVLVFVFMSCWLMAFSVQVECIAPRSISLDERDTERTPAEATDHMIYLNLVSFDPVREKQTPPGFKMPELTDTSMFPVSDNYGFYLVQFTGPVMEQWKEALESEGVVFYDYIPNHCFLAKLAPGQKDLLPEIFPFIRWVGDYLPYYKFSESVLRDYKHAGWVNPSIAGKKMTTRNVKVLMKKVPELEHKEYQVIAYPDCDIEELERQIEMVGGTVLSVTQTSWKAKLRVDVAPERLGQLASIPDVKFIEPKPQWQLHNNIAADKGVCFTRYVWDDLGYHGEGQVAAVCDTGIDQGSSITALLHDDFQDEKGDSRILAILDWSGDGPQDYSGHGTHVAGSVLGNGIMSGADPGTNFFPRACFAGSAPKANLVFQSVENDAGALIGIPDDLNFLFEEAYNEGAYFHTNSWGLVGAFGLYPSYSQDVDEFTWNNPDMTILFAAGNDGIDADGDHIIDPGSIGPPATAKNCISVGASENYRPEKDVFWGGYGPDPFFTDKVSDNVNGLAAFSSRGPVRDNRYKPDVVTPGTYILSSKSALAPVENFWQEANLYYGFMGGTSMACPLTCGMAALLRQFLVEDTEISNPSSALIKALLINGCTEIYPGQYGVGLWQEIPTLAPNNVEGWGRTNPAVSIAGSPTMLLDDQRIITNRHTNTYNFWVLENIDPLRVTLVWNDFPGGIEANGALVNDVDLTMMNPQAEIIYPSNPAQPGAKVKYSYTSSYDTAVKPLSPGDGVAVKIEPLRYPFEPLFIEYQIASPEQGTCAMDIRVYDEGPDGMPGNIIKEIRDFSVECKDFDDTWDAYIGNARLPVTDILVDSGNLFIEVRWTSKQEFCLLSETATESTDKSFIVSNTAKSWSPFVEETSIKPGIELLGQSVKQASGRDSVNNVEGIRIERPDLGMYQVRVYGANIAQSPQRYALVISGDITLTTPTITPVPTITPMPSPTPTPTPIYKGYTFQSSNEDWYYIDNVLGFNSPMSESSGGHLGLNALGSLNCFGYWHSPTIYLDRVNLYRASFTMRSTIGNKNLVPAFRLRVNQMDNWLSWANIVNSNMNIAPSSLDPAFYNIFFEPVSDTTPVPIQIAFDITSFDPLDDSSAWLYLEEVSISEMQVQSIPLSPYHFEYTFATGDDGWQYEAPEKFFDVPTTTTVGGHLGLNPNGSSKSFGFFYSPPVPVEGNTLYRGTFTLTSSHTAPDLVPAFRLRANHLQTQQTFSLSVNSYGQISPTVGLPGEYEFYIEPAATGLTESLELSFDLTNFDPEDDPHTWVYLEEVSIDEISVP